MEEVQADKYFKWLTEGKSFSDIRNDLLIRGYSEEQTKQIIHTLNDWLLASEIEKSKREQGKQLKTAGWIMAFIVAFICIYSMVVSALTITVIAIGGVLLSWGMIYAGNKIERGPSLFQPRFKQKRSFTR